MKHRKQLNAAAMKVNQIHSLASAVAAHLATGAEIESGAAMDVLDIIAGLADEACKLLSRPEGAR